MKTQTPEHCTEALLLVAHGSRRAESNTEVAHQGKKLQAALGDRFSLYGTAFLELAEPGIPAAIDSLAEAGAERIVVLPYFLAAGTHVTVDIPEIIDHARERHGHIDITLLQHLGASDQLTTALSGLLGTAH